MTLHLLPNLLGGGMEFLPPICNRVMEQVDGLIAESMGEGRRYLKRFATKRKAHEMPIALLEKNADLDFLLEPLLEGEEWGLISDAGLPAIADPGSRLVARARARKIPVKAYPGPSSLFLALMLSGLPSQEFSFHGYPPKTPDARRHALLEWEKQGGTHLFIEAPHRNQHTLDTLLSALQPMTKLCVAVQLTQPEEIVQTQSIEKWRKEPLELPKVPVTFLFHSAKQVRSPRDRRKKSPSSRA